MRSVRAALLVAACAALGAALGGACGREEPPVPAGPPARLSPDDVGAALDALRPPADPGEVDGGDASPGLTVASDQLLGSVRLLDELAEPIPGGRAAWIEGDELGLPRTLAEARSDSNGVAWLTIDRGALRPDQILLLAFDAPGRVRREAAFPPQQWRGEQLLSIGEVRLDPGGAIEGRVLDAAGEPASAYVAVSSPVVLAEDAPEREWLRYWPVIQRIGTEYRPVTRTGADGAYVIEGLPPGRYELVASALPGDPACLPTRRGGVEVRAGTTTTAPELELVPAAPEDLVRGTVLAPDGAPAEGVAVTLGLESTLVPSRTLTSAEGTFALPAPPGLELFVRVQDPGGRWAPLERAGVSAGGAALELRLEASEGAEQPR